MMKKILIFLVWMTAIVGIGRAAEQPLSAGQWRVTNSFDYYTGQIIDTKARTYFIALGLAYLPTESSWNEYSGQLFVYDKANGEFEGYNAGNYLSGNLVSKMAYNRDKGYLLIIYNDSNIDLLYDDDTLYTIPGLASSSIASSKAVNAISFDAKNDRIYLATDFGYIIIDDKKNVISESRIYNKALKGICRIADEMYVSTDDGVYVSPMSDRRADFNSFKKVDNLPANVNFLLPLSDTSFAAIRTVNPDAGVYLVNKADGELTSHMLEAAIIKYANENRDGYYLGDNGTGFQLTPDGNMKRRAIPSDANAMLHSSWDMQNLSILVPRFGLKYFRVNDENAWEPAKEVATVFPEPYRVYTFDKNDKYGMLLSHNTKNRLLYCTWTVQPWLLSTYKDGKWTNICSVTQPNARLQKATNSYGAIFDPVLEDYVYTGTREQGLFRLDLRDNSALQFASNYHGSASTPGFYVKFPRSAYAPYCDVSLPSFDKNGTLWVIHNPALVTNPEGPIYYWTAEDRKNNNVDGFKPLNVPNYSAVNDMMVIKALTYGSNSNIILSFNQMGYTTGIHFLDHRGTLEDTSDDINAHITSFVDQDGNQVPFVYVNCTYEDPQTGRVWVGTSTGLFWFNPGEVQNGNQSIRVHRVKIARNDGTNLADYLLDGSDVMDIRTDAAGRKWFATVGSGVIVTTGDGSEVLEKFTTDNSKIPSDQVYQIGIDPDSNAIWFGTSHQIATYYSDASPAGNDFNSVAIYPNPVRPDYYGDVTIDGLMEGSLVKIMDASGNLIKELGTSSGGRITWNLTNTSGARATTGVYYVLASASGDSSDAYVGKILVVR